MTVVVIKSDYLLETPIESDTTRSGENVLGAVPFALIELRTTNGQSAGNLGNQRVLRGHTSDPPKLRKMLAERYGPISWATMRLSDGELIESIETNKKDELSKSR